MKLIPDHLPKWARDALALGSEDFAGTDHGDMGTAFGLDASFAPALSLTPEEAAEIDAVAQDPLQRRLARRSGL